MDKLKEIKESEKHLLYRNKQVYDQIMRCIYTYDISYDELTDIKLDILSIALNAQQRGESLLDAIGEDLSEFCENVASESKKKSKSTRIKEKVLMGFSILDIYIVLLITLNILVGRSNMIYITLGYVIFIVINTALGCILYFHYRKQIKTDQCNINKLGIVSISSIIVSAILLVKLYNINLFAIKIKTVIAIFIVTIMVQLVDEAKNNK